MHQVLRRLAVVLSSLLSVALVVGPGPARAERPVARVGPPATTVVAVTANVNHSCALLSDGTVKCWGYNEQGLLGQGNDTRNGSAPGTMGPNLPPIALPRAATAISAGYAHTCALLDDGSVTCWGANDQGQLGLGDDQDRGDDPGEMGAALPVVALGAGHTAVALDAGANHTCALLDDGTLKCWGANDFGQLGLGDIANRGDAAGEMGNALPAVALGTDRTAVSVAAGGGTTCAVLDDGTAKCWGYNQDGALGLGDDDNRGDGPGEMGDALPPVALGTGRTVAALDLSGISSCALLDDGAVKCWGWNVHGSLGLGDVENRGDGPGEMGDALPPVALGSGRTAVAVSGSCAVLDDGTTKCWGPNRYGTLGLGDTVDRGDGAGAMGDALPAVSLGTGRTATQLASGDEHHCALLDDGSVKCWGHGIYGQLGLGDIANRGDGPGEMGDPLPRVLLLDGPAVTATLSADRNNVIDGEPLDYTLVVDNVGGVALTEAAVAYTGTPDCDGSLGDLAVGGHLTVDCAYVPTGDDVGTFTNQATVTTGEGATATSNAVETTVHAFRPAMTVSASADQTDVHSGDDIDFHVTITNTGNVALLGVSVTDASADECEVAVADIAPNATRTVDCTHTATTADIGAYSFTATVGSLVTEEVTSNAVGVDVAADRQPDLTLAKPGGTPVGDDQVGTDPTNPDQTVSVGRRRGGQVTFTARIANDGDTSARYRFRRLGADAGLSVRYLAGGVDVTRDVLDRTYLSAPVAPGASTTLRVQVTVGPRASRQHPHEIVLRALSAAPHAQADTVRGVIQVF